MSLEQIRAFMEASQEIRFKGANRKEIYSWVKGGSRTHKGGPDTLTAS